MSMKFFAIIALALTFSSLSFAGTTNSETNLINAKTTSCAAQVFDPSKSNDIEARYFRWLSAFSWSLVDFDLHITNIKFEIDGIPQSDVVTKEINGEELRALFNNPDPQHDNIIPRAPSGDQPTVFNLKCPLTVGGIVLTDAQDVAFNADVHVTIEGFAENSAGNQVNIHSGVDFTLANRGAQNK